MWQSLLLDPTEMGVFVDLTMKAVRKQYRFHSETYLLRCVEDMCPQYVWHTDYVDEVIAHLTAMYTN